MRFSRRSKIAIAHEAAEWSEVLKNADARERAAFEEWLTESPQRVREFLLMSAVDRALDCVDPKKVHDVQALLAQAQRDGVTALESYREPLSSVPARRSRQRRPLAVAAAVALAAVGTWQLWQASRWQDFSTAVGEQRTVQLSDGTVVALNTRSHLQVRFTAHARELRLLQGQALFKVSQDPKRPFGVQAGETLIQAVGTQFDVYRRSDASVIVAVVEGRVKVSVLPPVGPPGRGILSAGDRVSLAPDGGIRERAKVDETSAIAWQQRRLVFRRDKLSTVVEEFNRYNRRPQFKLDDAATADRHYSGEFDADDPGSLLQLLSTDPKLVVARHGDEVLIRGK